MPDGVAIVIPTIGRPSLGPLLERLRPQLAAAPVPVDLIVIEDVDGRGPAAARNQGWRAARQPWVAFLDDDVLPGPDWLVRLVGDLDQPPDVGGVQGRITVPRPEHAEPDDWGANTAGLESAVWATADMAYRWAALAAVDGFDERFPRAYREDADLAYRVRRAGWRLVIGARRTVHPVRPESPWACLRAQRGNADDALLRRMYGADWHRLLAAPAGRRRRHAAVLAAGVAAVLLAAVPSRTARQAAGGAAVAWLTGTAEFAVARLRAAPGSRRHLGSLMATSALIPPLAIGHWLNGWIRARHAEPRFRVPGPGVEAGPAGRRHRSDPAPGLAHEEDRWMS